MNKLVIQIILVLLAGLVTVGLSVYSLIDSDNKEKLLNQKQEELRLSQQRMIDLQNQHSKELQNKSDEIILLQNKLQEKSDSQIQSLSKLTNPIPSNFSMHFGAKLDLTKQDFEDILKVYKYQFPAANTNFLPFQSEKTNQGFEKINALKDVYFEVQIIFKKDEKILRLRFKKQPLLFLGYNTHSMTDVFVLSLQSSSNEIFFEGLQVSSQDIYTNYPEPSILDFRNSDVTISYNLFYPQPRQMGDKIAKLYLASKPDYIVLSVNEVTLNNQIHIRNLTKITDIEYKGKWDGL